VRILQKNEQDVKRGRKKKGNDDALPLKYTHIYHERAQSIYFFSLFSSLTKILLFLFFYFVCRWHCVVVHLYYLFFLATVGLILDWNARK
jgi:hypothetical protein